MAQVLHRGIALADLLGGMAGLRQLLPLRASPTKRKPTSCFRGALQLAPVGDLAEKIKNQQCRLADRVMRANAKGMPRMDAVMYLSSALEAYRALEAEGQKQLLAEAAAVGQKGLAINDADQMHQLRLCQEGNTISALQVACVDDVGVQLLLPGQDAGIDFAREYELAKGMAGARPAAESKAEQMQFLLLLPELALDAGGCGIRMDPAAGQPPSPPPQAVGKGRPRWRILLLALPARWSVRLGRASTLAGCGCLDGLPMGREHGPATIHQFLPQCCRGLNPDPLPKAIEPGAQIDVGGDGPTGEIQLQRVGMAVGGGVGLQHVGRIGVMPPGIAGQRPGEAHLLAGIAAHPFPQEREGPGGGRAAQGLQHARPSAG